MDLSQQNRRFRRIHVVAGAIALGGLFYAAQGAQKAYEHDFTDAGKLTYASALFEGSAGVTVFRGRIKRAFLSSWPETEIVSTPSRESAAQDNTNGTGLPEKIIIEPSANESNMDPIGLNNDQEFVIGLEPQALETASHPIPA